MVPGSSAWAQVTLYYGSWFASHAILGMFGGAVLKKLAVEVDRSNPGSQALVVRRVSSLVRSGTGSHQAFWELFYQSVPRLRPRVSPTLAVALTPISGNPRWQIVARNTVNYDTLEGLRAAAAFSGSFNKANFPASLPGALATQYLVLEGTLEIAFQFANQFALQTGALSILGGTGQLRDEVRRLVYAPKAPSIVSKTKKKALI
jgi:hypothetical protein